MGSTIIKQLVGVAVEVRRVKNEATGESPPPTHNIEAPQAERPLISLPVVASLQTMQHWHGLKTVVVAEGDKRTSIRL